MISHGKRWRNGKAVVKREVVENGEAPSGAACTAKIHDVETMATVNSKGMLITKRYNPRGLTKKVMASAPSVKTAKNGQPIEPTTIVMSAATINAATRPKRALGSVSPCTAADSRLARWFRFLASDTPDDSTGFAGPFGIFLAECGEINCLIVNLRNAADVVRPVPAGVPRGVGRCAQEFLAHTSGAR